MWREWGSAVVIVIIAQVAELSDVLKGRKGRPSSCAGNDKIMRRRELMKVERRSVVVEVWWNDVELG